VSQVAARVTQSAIVSQIDLSIVQIRLGRQVDRAARNQLDGPWHERLERGLFAPESSCHFGAAMVYQAN
jgi:hypothetical protein